MSTLHRKIGHLSWVAHGICGQTLRPQEPVNAARGCWVPRPPDTLCQSGKQINKNNHKSVTTIQSCQMKVAHVRGAGAYYIEMFDWCCNLCWWMLFKTLRHTAAPSSIVFWRQTDFAVSLSFWICLLVFVVFDHLGVLGGPCGVPESFGGTPWRFQGFLGGGGGVLQGSLNHIMLSFVGGDLFSGLMEHWRFQFRVALSSGWWLFYFTILLFSEFLLVRNSEVNILWTQRRSTIRIWHLHISIDKWCQKDDAGRWKLRPRSSDFDGNPIRVLSISICENWFEIQFFMLGLQQRRRT